MNIKLKSKKDQQKVMALTICALISYNPILMLRIIFVMRH